jgi:predicted nucleic acid-binding protein
VSRTVLLDAGSIGLVTNPRLSPESTACNRWLQSLVTSGIQVVIPEIADYEVRQELLRANKVRGIARLDELANLIEYLPITTPAMRQAAIFWAQARQQRQPTAGDKTIDGDMILAAQAVTFNATDMALLRFG